MGCNGTVRNRHLTHYNFKNIETEKILRPWIGRSSQYSGDSAPKRIESVWLQYRRDIGSEDRTCSLKSGCRTEIESVNGNADVTCIERRLNNRFDLLFRNYIVRNQ